AAEIVAQRDVRVFQLREAAEERQQEQGDGFQVPHVPSLVDEEVEAQACAGQDPRELRIASEVVRVVRVGVLRLRDRSDLRPGQRALEIREPAADVKDKSPLRSELEADLGGGELVRRPREQRTHRGYERGVRIVDRYELIQVAAQVLSGVDVQGRADRPIGRGQRDAAAIA